MTFNHLEDRIEAENVLPYLEFLENIQEPTRTVFGYTLDIAGYLDSQGISNQYAVFGGYAVLSNLMSAFGNGIARLWRGSTDIDMSGTYEVLNSLRAGYNMTNDRPSPNIPDKRTLKLDTGSEEECKIDFYLGGLLDKGQARRNSHFGVPLRVVKPEYVIRNKLYAPQDQIQHYGDIISMLAVIENEGGVPEDVLSALSNRREPGELKRRIVFAEKQFSNDRLGVFPSKSFREDLKKKLSKK